MTVNISDKDGKAMLAALAAGYHAYTADGTTAIETGASTREKAREIAEQFGVVLFIFE